MTATLPAIHVHRPRVSVSDGACRICDLPLGPDPTFVQYSAGSEWVCSGCWAAIEAALAEVGKRRVDAFLGSGEPILPVEGESPRG